MTLNDARAWLRARVEDGGAKCPCCTQFAKVYRRKINSTMARTLITMYRFAGSDFVHVPDLPGDTHEASQLAWWGLIEDGGTRRDDGGRAGWWRLTPLGVAFVRGGVSVPSHARIYDGRCLGLDDTRQGDIHDVLGSRFNYEELMAS